jgi:hypothetical protein
VPEETFPGSVRWVTRQEAVARRPTMKLWFGQSSKDSLASVRSFKTPSPGNITKHNWIDQSHSFDLPLLWSLWRTWIDSM